MDPNEYNDYRSKSNRDLKQIRKENKEKGRNKTIKLNKRKNERSKHRKDKN